MVLVRCDRDEAVETRDCQEPEAGGFTEAAEQLDWLRLRNQTTGFEFGLCHLLAICL